MATFSEAPLSCRTAEFPRSGWKSWLFEGEPSHPQRGSSAGSHTPHHAWFTHHFVPSPTSAFPGSVSGRRADCGTTKYPESLCLISALPLSGRRRSPPARTLLPGHGSYGLIRQSQPAPPLLQPKPRSRSLCRLLPVPCCRRDLPDVISVNPSLGAWAPITAVPWSAFACFFLHVIGLPPYLARSAFPHLPVKTIS